MQLSEPLFFPHCLAHSLISLSFIDVCARHCNRLRHFARYGFACGFRKSSARLAPVNDWVELINSALSYTIARSLNALPYTRKFASMKKKGWSRGCEVREIDGCGTEARDYHWSKYRRRFASLCSHGCRLAGRMSRPNRAGNAHV